MSTGNIPASAVPIWKCEFFETQTSGSAKLDALTVGSKFGWKCHGDIAVQWTQAPLQLVFKKPEDQHSLALLQTVRQDPNDVQFEVTAYKPGPHTPEYIRVLQGQGTPGEVGFEAGAQAWTVQSVIDPKQQPPPQPYGPFGPWSLSIPTWFIVAAALLLVAILALIARQVRKVTQRRRMLEELARHKTALLPLHQFYRDGRLLRRRLYTSTTPEELKRLSEDLDQEFRLYILRQFQVPALEWSDPVILKDLRRRHRKTYDLAREPLKRTLRELTKLKARATITAKDVEQMYDMSLETAEKLERARGGSA